MVGAQPRERVRAGICGCQISRNEIEDPHFRIQGGRDHIAVGSAEQRGRPAHTIGRSRLSALRGVPRSCRQRRARRGGRLLEPSDGEGARCRDDPEEAAPSIPTTSLGSYGADGAHADDTPATVS
jgi:hypothetical protein